MSTLRERAQAAIQRAEETPAGPWRACGNDRGGCECGMVWSEPTDMQMTARAFDEDTDVPTDDEAKKIARFVAHARTDVPDMGKTILRLTSPEMRDRIALAVLAGCMRQASPNDLADSIMGLLREEPT